LNKESLKKKIKINKINRKKERKRQMVETATMVEALMISFGTLGKGD
jgi:hypothetical protein